MRFSDKIRMRILKYLGLEHLSENPASGKFTFINDYDEIKRKRIEEYKTWYNGDASDLLAYYTSSNAIGYKSDGIYFRNDRNLFWSISSGEENIKRVHSGLPQAMVTTLVSLIGYPNKINLENDNELKELKRILSKNKFRVMQNQQQMPLTLAEGYGAYKISVAKELAGYPIIQYYEANDVEFIYQDSVLKGVIFKDYYQKGTKSYVLYETRRIDNGNSYIEYNLCQQFNEYEKEVPLSILRETEKLEAVEFKNYDKILAVPSIFFFDPTNKGYGKSVYAPRITLFDDLDQSLSQRSQTSRVSTPVEYYPADLLTVGKNGKINLPKTYNRQFLDVPYAPDGDGKLNGKIQTSQPQLNFEQYNEEQMALVNMILIGYMSPASFGIDVARKDNADAQREKEKTTIMTRNNVIESQIDILSDLFNLVLDVNNYMKTAKMQEVDRDFTITFKKFANPSFETMLPILSEAWDKGAISNEKYVDILYDDTLSDEDKQKEIKALEKNKQRDTLESSEFELGNEEDEANARKDLSAKGRNNKDSE